MGELYTLEVWGSECLNAVRNSEAQPKATHRQRGSASSSTPATVIPSNEYANSGTPTIKKCVPTEVVRAMGSRDLKTFEPVAS